MKRYLRMHEDFEAVRFAALELGVVLVAQALFIDSLAMARGRLFFPRGLGNRLADTLFDASPGRFTLALCLSLLLVGAILFKKRAASIEFIALAQIIALVLIAMRLFATLWYETEISGHLMQVR
jgi:hypothetical protein